MKKIYSVIFLITWFLLPSCSKDFLKPYDDRIIGTWQITEVKKIGLGGSIGNLAFREGSFSFLNDGSMTYTNSSGQVFRGTWDIRKKTVDNDGQVFHGLQITAVNFTTQEVLGEYYDDINFTGTNSIKARIISTTRTYVTHLRR